MKIDLNNYKIVKTSETIEANSKKGTKFWRMHILQELSTGKFYTCSESWHTTSSGPSKAVWSIPYYAEPTNVGRANERSNEEQSLFEFDAAVKKQLDKRKADKPLPMLAQKYEERHQHIVYPCAVSPKLDGFRVLYDGLTAWTRGNKSVVPEVFDHLHFDTQGYTVDGELLLPGFRPVNETRSAGTKFKKGVSDTLQYHIFDIVDESLPYTARLAIIHNLVNAAGDPNILAVEMAVANTQDEILEHHNSFVKMGYEGTMIRNSDSLYEINKRSNNLLKMKDFLEGDYEIVDVIPSGGGNAAEMGKFVCKDEKGDLFESTATGSEDLRREYLKNKQDYIGKFAKIKYVCLSGAKKIPFHSNVLEIRDREEF